MFRKLSLALILSLVLILMAVIPVSASTYTETFNTIAVEDNCRVDYDGESWSLSCAHTCVGFGYYDSDIYDIGSGLRFQSVIIPPGAIIKSAYLKLTSYNSTGNDYEVNATIRGEDIGKSEAFSTYSNYDSRDMTTEKVYWDNIEPWTKDAVYQSPDISDIIQEIISNENWASGNALSLFLVDRSSDEMNGAYRFAYSYSVSSSKAPQLYVSYSYTEGSSTTTNTATTVTNYNELKSSIDSLTAATSEINNKINSINTQIEALRKQESDNDNSLRSQIEDTASDINNINSAISNINQISNNVNSLNSKLETLSSNQNKSIDKILKSDVAFNATLSELESKSNSPDYIPVIILIILLVMSALFIYTFKELIFKNNKKG